MHKQKAHRETDNSKICFLGTFPPRECGIATFTRDLATAMNKRFNPSLKSRVVAINENDTTLRNYDSRVVMQIDGSNISDYINLARKINKSQLIKIVCIQHEFGIFGGEYGNYIIPFIETLEKPVVTTFHSILPFPDQERKRVVEAIIEKSAAVIVMAKKAKEILDNHYKINIKKIHVVPHGIPNVSLQSAEKYKKKLGLDGKKIISTFGMLSRGKGIEYMIKAMPEIIKNHPEANYLIIGETHPVVRGEEGEEYRNHLMNIVKELKLEEHVKFYNRYLTLQELIEYLLASDVYVCTNLDKNQIVSGTLAYATGCGKAVVSTPSVYAEELLTADRGVLVEFKEPESYVKAVNDILSDPEFKERLEQNAYANTRQMTWSNVAASYLRIFNQIVEVKKEVTEKYPIIKLNHLKRLTDDFGIIQFAEHFHPDKNSGYTVDDNARALIVATRHYQLYNQDFSMELIKTHLNFLGFSQEESGKFINHISQQRNKLNKNYSEDSYGRAMLSLSYAISELNNENNENNGEVTKKAETIFNRAYSWFEKLRSPRAKAFSIMALYYYNKKFSHKRNLALIKRLSDSLVESYNKESSEQWQWFEKYLTYSNSKIPEALFYSYLATKDKKYLDIAKETLDFLTSLLIVGGELSLIGQNGWYNKDGKRAFFDQQPVDASSMVSTYLTAYSVTGNKKYYENAVISFNWFLGKNYLKQMMYNESTGGCYDGLGRFSVNLNQGAESTLAYLSARLLLEKFKKDKAL
ncbi:glycosyltransferase [Candidatus Pacearchaeota archaeon]|nr:glycosyltransferase [Candidatus Pacearchaeota archaeon]